MLISFLQSSALKTAYFSSLLSCCSLIDDSVRTTSVLKEDKMQITVEDAGLIRHSEGHRKCFIKNISSVPKVAPFKAVTAYYYLEAIKDKMLH